MQSTAVMATFTLPLIPLDRGQQGQKLTLGSSQPSYWLDQSVVNLEADCYFQSEQHPLADPSAALRPEYSGAGLRLRYPSPSRLNSTKE